MVNPFQEVSGLKMKYVTITLTEDQAVFLYDYLDDHLKWLAGLGHHENKVAFTKRIITKLTTALAKAKS